MRIAGIAEVPAAQAGAVLSVPGPPELRVGDRTQILPVHACVWSDLQVEVYGTRRGRLVERIRIDAFRHSL